MPYTATNNLNDLVETTPAGTEPVSNLGLAMLETRRTFKAVILAEHNADGTHASVNGAVLVAGSVPLTALVGGTALGANSVATANLQDGSVTTSKYANLSMIGAAMAAKTITADKALAITSGGIWVGQPGGSMQEVVLSGAATMDNTGLVTLGAPDTTFAIAMFADIETTLANGGTFTAGGWRTRALNSTIIDSSSIFTLAANTLTWSTDGTYYIKAEAVGYKCGNHQIRLWDPVNNVTIADGIGATAVAEQTPSSAETVLTLAPGVTQSLIIQHQCSVTEAADGMGNNTTFGTNNIYARITLIKIQ